MRIALFGGSFDPPHLGHVAVARAAADAFGLDRVLFTPAGRQPLKAAHGAASYADRLQMVQVLCALDTRFHPSDLDRPHPDGTPNYTVDTLAALCQGYPGARLFSLAGVDSFRTLGHWREPQRLLSLAEWIVVSRPGYAFTGDGAPEGLTLTPAQRARIHRLDSVHEDISATGLRERLYAGEDCSGWLTPQLAAEIARRGLYWRPPRNA